jgi:mono/diheme cytochrome c family protein
MKNEFVRQLTVLAAMTLLGTGIAFAQEAGDTADFGKFLYMNNCAVCHGTTGKGDGPYREFIQEIPALTTLQKDNGGVFPISRVYEVIEGRQEIKTHGPRDMPIWGTRFSMEAAEKWMDVEYDQEAYIRTRVLHLVDYLYRIQE